MFRYTLELIPKSHFRFHGQYVTSQNIPDPGSYGLKAEMGLMSAQHDNNFRFEYFYPWVALTVC